MPIVTTSRWDLKQENRCQFLQALRCYTSTPRRAPRAPWKAHGVRSPTPRRAPRAPWKAHDVSHTPWRPLSASGIHPTTPTTAVLDGGLAGFNSHRQRTALRTRLPRTLPGRTEKVASSISLGGALVLCPCRGFGACRRAGAGSPNSVHPLVAADVMPA